MFMLPNSNSSNKITPNNIGVHRVYNVNYDIITELGPKQLLRIIVTEHLCEPCPRFYTDAFHNVLIVCEHPSHTNLRNDKKV